MTTRYTSYQQRIAAATKLTDADDVRAVEELMRVESGGCLDHLSARDFDAEARTSLKVLRAMPAATAAWYRGTR